MSSLGWATTWWAQGIREFLDLTKKRRAISQHLSREAARYSHAPEPKTVGHMMAIYARQMHLAMPWTADELSAASPGTLKAAVMGGIPRFTPAQRRRITKRINRMKGQTA